MTDDRSSTDLSAAWRAQMPLRDGVAFLNPGTLGGTLRCALDRAESLRRAWVEDGAGGSLDLDGADAYQRLRRGADGVRRRLARWLGSEPRNVALTGNVTDGLHQSLLSVDWQAGDRVITTDREHEALTRALERLSVRRGVEVRVVPFPGDEDPDSVADAVAANLDDRTRVVALSHVSHRTGVALDVAAVAKAIAGHGAWLVVDGAHGAGTRLPVISAGVDFYSFPGHKWLFGPVGTGVLWVSDKALSGTGPLLAGSPSMAEDGLEYRSMDGAWRYEAGTRDWAAVAGLGEAVAFRQAWPEATLIAHYGELAGAFRIGLGDRWPVTGSGPVLLLAMPEAEAWQTARDAWRRCAMVVKPTIDGIRVSFGPWLTPAESERYGRLLAQR